MKPEHQSMSWSSSPGWVWFLVFGVIMTAKYFPGLENETLYSGNVFQILNPDAFIGDPFRSPDIPWWQRPTQLSLFYGLVWLGGDIWLDDRFVAVFYLGLVILSLIGLDRIAKHFGLNGPYERLILLLIFLKDHQILTSKVLVAHHQDVNPSAMVIPAIIWLFYAVIAQRRFIWTVLGCALVTLISIRLALCVCVTALLGEIVLRPVREKWIAALLLVGGLGLFAAALMHFTPTDDILRLAIWDKFVDVENNDADPFAPDGIGSMWIRFPVFAAVIIATWVFTPENAAGRALKTIILIAISIFLLGGVYINAAPDAMKIPLLISFVPARISGWLQNLCYIGLISGILLRYRTCEDLRHTGLLVALVGVLYIIGPGHIHLWSALVAAGCFLAVVGLLIKARWSNGQKSSGNSITRLVENRAEVLFVALLFVSIASYGQAAYRTADAWKSTFTTGIFGNNPSALWHEVTPYIAGIEPPVGTVMTYQCRNPAACNELVATRAFATRSGLAMPTPEVAGGDFDKLDSWEVIEHQEHLVEEIANQLVTGNTALAATTISQLQASPDVLIVPDVLSPEAHYSVGPYRESHRIDPWIILKKEPQT